MRRNISKKSKSVSILKLFFTFLKKSGKDFRNLSTILILSQILIASSIIISEPTNMKIFLEKLSRRILWSFDTKEPKDYLNYIKDFSSTFLPFSKDLERLTLDLKYDEILKLDCSREYTKAKYGIDTREYFEKCDNNTFQSGILKSNNNTFKIKIRSKGDRDLHRINFKKMSFKIDIKGDKRYKGMEEFSIQMPIIRNYITELFAAKLMKKEGIISPRHEYIKLFVNGEYFGIRHIEENPSKELIESNERRLGPLFSLNDEIGRWYNDSSFNLHEKKFWGSNKNNIAIEARTILEKSKNEQTVFDEYFDYNLWAKYFAIIDALKLWHGSMPKSVKYFMNPTTGKIEPVFFDGHTNTTRILDNYNFYRLLDDPKTQDKFYCEYLCDDKYIFYKRFFGTYENPNIIFYEKYINHLIKLTSKNYQEEILKPIWENLSTERSRIYRDFWRIDRINHPGIMPYIAPWEEIKKSLNNTHMELIASNQFEPEIIIDNRYKKPIFLRNNLSKIPQIANLKCLTNNKKYTYILPKGKLVKINSKYNSECPIGEQLISINKLTSRYSNIKKGYLTFQESSNNKEKIDNNNYEDLIFDKEYYEIKSPLIVNRKNISILKNTKICLKDQGYIYFKNSIVKIMGAEESPVIIDNCDNNDQFNRGIIIENSNVSIKNLELKKLNSPNINLRLLDGGLNFINSDIEINELSSNYSIAEDAINIINSKLNANKINIYNTKSDAFDSDFSEFSIKELNCKAIGNDCLDTSFSKGKIIEMDSKKINDKAISIGEKSSIYIDNVSIVDSEIGIVSKDLSKLKINNYEFTNVKLPIVSFIKKEEFGIPEIKIKNNIRNLNEELLLISKDSKVTINGKLYKSNYSSKEIESLLYGNQYGVKTKR